MVLRRTAAVGLLAVVSMVGCASTADQAGPSATASASSSAPSASAPPPSSAAPSPTGAAAAPTAGRATPSTSAGAASSAGAGGTPESDAQRSAPAPAPEPEQEAGFPSTTAAIEALLQSRGADFAGPCDQAEPADVGMYCYVVVEDRGDEVVVTVGQVFSEFDAYLLLRLGETGWQVVDTADYPYPDGGPLPF